MLLQERLAFPAIVEMLRGLGGCLRHIHEQGLVHGDYKPLNAVRMTPSSSADSWRLIDFDCAAPFGEPLGLKSPSEAYCPPEMTWAVEEGDLAGSIQLKALRQLPPTRMPMFQS